MMDFVLGMFRAMVVVGITILVLIIFIDFEEFVAWLKRFF